MEKTKIRLLIEKNYRAVLTMDFKERNKGVKTWNRQGIKELIWLIRNQETDRK
jgi:hypothetical protein